MILVLSILSLYNYYPDVFDELKLPAGMDKNLQVSVICAELAELDLIYNDPDMLKTLIGIWSSRQLDSWTKLFATTKFTYDPIANVDAEEVRTTEYGKIDTRTPNLKRERNTNVTDEVTPGDVITESVQGYDSSTWADSRKQARSGSTTNTTTGSDTYTDTGEDVNAATGKDIETLKRHGNIGVTSTQQLIEAERDVDKFDMYAFISDAFKTQFCIMVY